jgi:hypothetical protein
MWSRRWTQSPTVIRSTAAAQAVQVCLGHCADSVISGRSAASHRPALAMIVRAVARTLGVSAEVACQRSTQAAHAGLVPDAGGVVAAGARRRVAVAEPGSGALQRIARSYG